MTFQLHCIAVGRVCVEDHNAEHCDVLFKLLTPNYSNIVFKLTLRIILKMQSQFALTVQISLNVFKNT